MTEHRRKECVHMFTSIRLRNFKGYKDSSDVPLRPLTVIIGKNNSGKSTILHALLLLKQTLEDPSGNADLVTSGPLVELGGWHEVLHGADAATERTIGLSLTQEALDGSLDPLPLRASGWPDSAPNRLDLSFAYSSRANAIKTKRAALWSQDQKVLDAGGRGRAWSSDLITPSEAEYLALQMNSFLPRMSYEFDDRPASVSASVHGFVSRVNRQSWAWDRLFQFTHRIGPVRSRVPWYSGLGTRAFSEYGQRGENLLAVLGRQANVGSGRALIDVVNAWVRDNFQMLEKLYLKNIDERGLVRSLVGHEKDALCDINVAAMGEGVSQILPIIAVAAARKERECLLIEQPEIHLHPALQADLADLFISTATKGGRQVIVETHSEHLLLRVRRRVAEGKLAPDKVSVLYVEKKGPRSTVHRLDMNSNGHFGDWPEGFFDEAYQEAMALAMASAK